LTAETLKPRHWPNTGEASCAARSSCGFRTGGFGQSGDASAEVSAIACGFFSDHAEHRESQGHLAPAQAAFRWLRSSKTRLRVFLAGDNVESDLSQGPFLFAGNGEEAGQCLVVAAAFPGTDRAHCLCNKGAHG
jgi:hypothetical protein